MQMHEAIFFEPESLFFSFPCTVHGNTTVTGVRTQGGQVGPLAPCASHQQPPLAAKCMKQIGNAQCKTKTLAGNTQCKVHEANGAGSAPSQLTL
jgi:hypothetical protein